MRRSSGGSVAALALALVVVLTMATAAGCSGSLLEEGSTGGGTIPADIVGDAPEDAPGDVRGDLSDGLECVGDEECTATGDLACAYAVCEGGRCVTRLRPDGTACADQDNCSEDTTCFQGTCGGGTVRDCDDDNPCTADLCAAGGECKHVDASGPCEDGDPCTANDHCSGGLCRPGDTVNCDDGNPCTDDRCADEDGCVYTPNDASCDDGEVCTTGDVCSGGACAGTPDDCDDGDPCTIDTCRAGEGCRNAPDPECFCTTDTDCDDDDPCTLDTCVADVGCRHDNLCDCTVDADCSDGVACTVNVCNAGGKCERDTSACPCRPGDAAPCDDGNPCTSDECTSEYACSNTPFDDGVACNDGDPCTHGDACLSGECVWDTYACPEQVCDDGLDNDGDGLTDCTDPDCADAPRCGEHDCTNTIDDDGDGATDCADADCDEDFACFQQCTPTADAVCGQAILGSTAFAIDAVTLYPDCGTRSFDGGEFVFRLDLPIRTFVSLRLEDVGASADVSIVLLEGSCDSASCVAVSEATDSLTHEIAAGVPYFVVVDGPEGGGGDFTLLFDCGDAEFLCGDQYDNDFDGLVDCDDPDCADDAVCDVESDCENLVDDDGDGFTDCIDPDCVGDPGCEGPTVEHCANGRDDDQNGLTDCFDFTACGEDPACAVVCDAPQIVDCDTLVNGTTAGTGDTVRWYPFCTGQLLDGGERVYIVTPPRNAILNARLLEGAADRDVLVLGPEQCNAYTCIRYHDSAVTYEVTGGRPYYVVVDSAAGAEGPFSLAIQCGLSELFCEDGVDDDGDGQTDCADDECALAPGCAETVCDDGDDNEGDGLFDCQDPDCWESPDCTCVPTDTIACDAAVSGTTVGRVNQMTDYPCGPFLIADAPERIFTFTADRSGPVTALLDTGPGYPLDLFVLAGDCGPQRCAAYGDASVTFTVVAGETYQIVVDATEGFSAPFQLALDCGGAPEIACMDGMDDDGDGRIDCADSDCAGADGCRSECEAAGVPIACGQTLSLTTEGRPNVLSGYDCVSWPETGGEALLRFIPPTDDEIIVRVSHGAGYELDVVLVEAECDPSACVDYADVQMDTNVYGGHLYYVVIDGYVAEDAGPFDVTLDCLLSGTGAETVCGDFFDDDADGMTDCADPDCDWFGGCAGELCQADAFLTCGGAVSGNTSARRNGMVTYACAGMLYLGGDVAYRFVAPSDGDVTFTLSNAPADLELFVLEDACGSSRCVANAVDSATFAAERGHTYYVVVDGLFSGGGAYRIDATCP